MRLRAIFAIAATLLLSLTPSRAQTAWPTQPVHVVVPFPAGGPADILARFVSQKLGELWGQAFIVENRPGGNTAVGAAHVRRLANDGYNLFVVMDVTMVLNPLTTKELPYDPVKDFDTITLLSKNTSLLSVREDGPRDVMDLIARAKANPGKMNFGAGIITTRLAGEFFNRTVGINVQYVPYQGSPPTVQGLMSGSVDFIVDGAASSLPLIQAGKMRALAKMNGGNLKALPQLRTLAAEANAPALDDISTWIALVSPAGTPREIIDKIQRAVAAMYKDPTVVDALEKAGINPASSTPEEFAAFITKETARWGGVIKDAGIELN